MSTEQRAPGRDYDCTAGVLQALRTHRRRKIQNHSGESSRNSEEYSETSTRAVPCLYYKSRSTLKKIRFIGSYGRLRLRIFTEALDLNWEDERSRKGDVGGSDGRNVGQLIHRSWNQCLYRRLGWYEKEQDGPPRLLCAWCSSARGLPWSL